MQHNHADEMQIEQPTITYLDKLNSEQLEAVEVTDGAVLVLAGAGTGKTRVLTTRIAHIINSGLAYPNQILAVTFTNKASREMTERVVGMLHHDVSGMWLGTFHSICAKILRRHAEAMGFQSNFTILDADDQVRLLKKIMEEAGVDTKKHAPKILMSIIQSYKDKGWNPNQVQSGFAGDFADGKIVQIYDAYQRRLRNINAMDFGDLLLHCLTMFQKQPDILAVYHGFFKYILVDEYQDTNVAQYMWLRLLAQASGNICCVGDDDQSIYSWRGAQVGNILRFTKDFPNAITVKLEQNYRSTHHILAAASGLIANNKGRIGKTLRTDSNDGEQLRVKFLWDGDEEAKFVANEIEAMSSSLTREKHSMSQFAVLVRAGFQTRAFEERFLTLNIPYKVVGGLRFYERAEIRDAIAYIHVLMQPNNDLAFERIINLPKRGIGKSSLEVLYRNSRNQGITLYDSTAQMAQNAELPTKAGKVLGALVEQFANWRNALNAIEHDKVVEQMLEESGYLQMWRDEAKKERSPEAEGRLENLRELVRALAEFESLGDFLEHISLVMDNDQNKSGEMVNIMTLHAAKGLEFDTVFLPGWEEGLFPHQRALDESGGGGLEEERRLAYVGITRARKNLFITHAANRRIYNQWQNSIPSRFLKELPAQHVDILSSNLGFNSNANRPAFERKTEPLERAITQLATDTNAFNTGTRIFHDKFGYGYIQNVNGDNLDINFDHSGRKTLKSGFVKKA